MLPEANLKQLPIGTVLTPEQPMKAALQPFQAAYVIPMEHSITLESQVAGGVLLRTIRTLPFSCSLITILAMQSGATTIRRWGFLYVV